MKLTNERLIFPGTKGEIEEENEFHKFHTSLIMEYKKTKILFDFGLKHSPVLDEKINEFDAIFITHSHPDHYIWAIEYPTQRIKVPVYLTPVTYFSSNRRPENFILVKSGNEYKIKDIVVEPLEVIHSIRSPAVCYKIINSKVVLYAPDLVDINNSKEAVFKGIDILVADGSTLNINMVRRKNDQLFGHAMIKTVVNWCKKYGIPRLVITHLGKQMVRTAEEEIIEKIRQYSEGKLDFSIAHDGMIIDV
jgi:ribonuclease BN (tRNA processing enzyme)